MFTSNYRVFGEYLIITIYPENPREDMKKICDGLWALYEDERFSDIKGSIPTSPSGGRLLESEGEKPNPEYQFHLRLFQNPEFKKAVEELFGVEIKL